jgi:hypothetical protein
MKIVAIYHNRFDHSIVVTARIAEVLKINEVLVSELLK